MKEFWRNLYEIEDEKIKEIEKKSSWIRKKKIKTDKKYYDCDDIEYKGIRDVKIYLICQLIKININQ